MNGYILEIKVDEDSHYYSRQARSFAGVQTQPYLKGISNITRALHLDHTFENTTMTVTLHNPADPFLAAVDLSEATLRLYYETADTVVFSGRVCDTPKTKGRELAIKADIYSLLSNEIVPTLEKNIFNDLPDDNNGKPGTVMLGTADDSDGLSPKGMCRALRTNSGDEFLANWQPMSQLIGVYDKDRNNITSQATMLIESGRTMITLDNATTDLEIFYNGEGPEQSGELIDNPAAMLDLLIDDYAALEIDTTSFAASAAIFAGRGYQDNLIYIDNNWHWVDLFREIGKSFDCHVFLDRQAKVHMKILDWGSEQPIETLHPALLKDFEVSKNIKKITGSWRGIYRFHFQDRQYTRRLLVESGNEKERLQENAQQFVRLEGVCLDATGRKAFLYGKETYEYRFGLPARQAFGLELGDVVQAKHRKNPLGNDYRLIWLLRENVSPQTSFVFFEGLDITSIVKDVFILYEDDHPDVAVLQDSTGPTLL